MPWPGAQHVVSALDMLMWLLLLSLLPLSLSVSLSLSLIFTKMALVPGAQHGPEEQGKAVVIFLK